MWCYVSRQVVHNISKHCITFISGAKVWNVGNYWASYIVSHPWDLYLLLHCCENLKSHITGLLFCEYALQILMLGSLWIHILTCSGNEDWCLVGYDTVLIVNSYQYFWEACCLCLQGLSSLRIVMSVTVYQLAYYHIPEDMNLHEICCEDLRSLKLHFMSYVSTFTH
jgi:hypothetical protein